MQSQIVLYFTALGIFFPLLHSPKLLQLLHLWWGPATRSRRQREAAGASCGQGRDGTHPLFHLIAEQALLKHRWLIYCRLWLTFALRDAVPCSQDGSWVLAWEALDFRARRDGPDVGLALLGVGVPHVETEELDPLYVLFCSSWPSGASVLRGFPPQLQVFKGSAGGKTKILVQFVLGWAVQTLIDQKGADAADLVRVDLAVVVARSAGCRTLRAPPFPLHPRPEFY